MVVGQPYGLAFFETDIVFASNKLQISFGEGQERLDDSANDSNFEIMFSVQEILKRILKFSFSQCFKYDFQGASGLSREDLSRSWSCFKHW